MLAMTRMDFARRLGIELFFVLCIGFVLGLFGPFGTYAMQTPIRLTYWMVFGVIGYTLFRPLIVLGEWVSEELRISRIISVGFGMAVAAVPMTLLIAAMFNGFQWPSHLTSSAFGLLFFQVWLIGFLTHGLMVLLFRDKEAEASPLAPVSARIPANDPVPDAPRFADRLPAGFGPVLALQGEDHYVRVHGDSRSELILVRLRDAMAELGEAAGMQVHRSWWVAHDTIATVERDGRAGTVVLTNGLRVPVSRENMPRIRDRL
jgi:LytTr DNA-binding domain